MADAHTIPLRIYGPDSFLRLTPRPSPERACSRSCVPELRDGSHFEMAGVWSRETHRFIGLFLVRWLPYLPINMYGAGAMGSSIAELPSSINGCKKTTKARRT